MIRRKFSNLLPRLALSVVLSVLLGCASTGRVQLELQQKMVLGDYPMAIQLVEDEKEKSFGGKNRLLYYLERAMLLR